tara:strand:+ start:4108 stop:5025 length:918 start_codon:yes stop_codon:yes gene_type:complete
MNGFKADRKQLEGLSRLVKESFAADIAGKNILFMDYPLHNNVGDWLIYHGTLNLLKNLGCTVKGQYSTHNYQNTFSQNIPKDWIILLHGGGNFGDIYDVHQNLRLDVIKQFPEHKIIAMPQSVHYDDPKNFQRDAQFYLQHKDLTVHIRDRESYDFLHAYLPETMLRLTPDMASTLIGRWPWTKGNKDTLYFRRKDKEAPAMQENLDNSFDWVNMFSSIDRKIMGKIMRLARLEGQYQRNLGAAYLWMHYTNFLLKKASATFAPYQKVDTDRLHGMIFALLLGKEVILRDNSYGKIGRYVGAWFK